MTPDPSHPLCPVARRVLTRRGIYKHAPGYSVAVETIDDDTDLDRMTVTIHVTRPGVAVEKWGPMHIEGQASLGVKEWERAWASVLNASLDEAVWQDHNERSVLEQSLDRAAAEVLAKAVKDHEERAVLECMA